MLLHVMRWDRAIITILDDTNEGEENSLFKQFLNYQKSFFKS